MIGVGSGEHSTLGGRGGLARRTTESNSFFSVILIRIMNEK